MIDIYTKSVIENLVQRSKVPVFSIPRHIYVSARETEHADQSIHEVLKRDLQLLSSLGFQICSFDNDTIQTHLPSDWRLCGNGGCGFKIVSGNGDLRASWHIEKENFEEPDMPREEPFQFLEIHTRYEACTKRVFLKGPRIHSCFFGFVTDRKTGSEDARIIYSTPLILIMHREYYSRLEVPTREKASNLVDVSRIEALRLAEHGAIAWLNERYPAWRNPLAYWDE